MGQFHDGSDVQHDQTWKSSNYIDFCNFWLLSSRSPQYKPGQHIMQEFQSQFHFAELLLASTIKLLPQSLPRNPATSVYCSIQSVLFYTARNLIFLSMIACLSFSSSVGWIVLVRTKCEENLTFSSHLVSRWEFIAVIKLEFDRLELLV